MATKGTRSKVKITINTSLNSEVLNKIYQYCQWANIENINLFIEKAAQYYLENNYKNDALN